MTSTTEKSPAHPPAPPQPLLLVIDDDEGVRAAVRVISRLEFNVQTASNGQAAREIWRKQPVDVVTVGSSRVDLQACKLEYSIVSPK